MLTIQRGPRLCAVRIEQIEEARERGVPFTLKVADGDSVEVPHSDYIFCPLENQGGGPTLWCTMMEGMPLFYHSFRLRALPIWSMPAPRNNANAKKDPEDVADPFLHIRVTSAEKSDWKHAAGPQSLSSWIRATLNHASKEQTRRISQSDSCRAPGNSDGCA